VIASSSPSVENGRRARRTENALQGRTAAMMASGAMLGVALFMSGAATAQKSVAAGEMLTFDRSKGNCLTCHEIKGGEAAGNVGPALFDMKSRFSDSSELAAIIFDETKRNPLTVMPPFGRTLILTKQEIESIIDFLYTR
jgi:L-cysteine S-thiosulfotransferase